jgi:hypothetical protein
MSSTVDHTAKTQVFGWGYLGKSRSVKWATRGLLGLTVGVGLTVLAWITLLSPIVEHELRNVTGFDFHVAVLSANPFTGSVEVQGLAANNPVGYPTPDFVDLRELRAKAELYPWVFSKKIIVDDLDLDLGKIVLVRRHDGKSNVGQVITAFTGSSTPSKPTPYLVKALHLRVEELVFSDYAGRKPVERDYPLHIDQSYSNVSDWRQLLAPKLMKSLKPGMVEELVRFFPINLGDELTAAFKGIGTKIKETDKKAEGFFRGLFARHPAPSQ